MTPRASLTNLFDGTKIVIDTLRAAAEATEALHAARIALESAETTVTLNGLEGSNAETRKAFLAAETWHEREAVAEAEAAHRAAKLEVEIAKLDMDYDREVCAMRRAELHASNTEA